MNELNRKLAFWIATSVYVFFLIVVIKGASYGPGFPVYIPNNVGDYEKALFTTDFSMLEYYVIPSLMKYTLAYLLYLFFILLIPRLSSRNGFAMFFYILCVFVLSAFIFASAGTYTDVYLLYSKTITVREAYYKIFFNSFIFSTVIFGFYGIYQAIFFLARKISEEGVAGRNIILQHGLLGFSCWILLFTLIYFPGSPDDYSLFWLCVLLPVIPLYVYISLKIIPAFILTKISYWRLSKIILLVAIVSSVAFCLVNLLLFSYFDYRILLSFAAISIVLHSIVTWPLCWQLYLYRLAKRDELTGLKKSVSQSETNIELLRSQINPHFLFNTLNALYGTALLDKSKRTALGIQKLGDMMRFMLHENQQDKILLVKEIAYLKNYIELQSLRIPSDADVLVDTAICDATEDLWIAPMVLIPFIENAFNYGISPTQRSWIKLNLDIEDKTLKFSIVNSIILESNLSKAKSGIGLRNVKDRLQLIYPGNHVLLIQSDEDKFSVNLSLNLI